MLTFTVFISIFSLVAAAGVFFFLWGRGVFATPIVTNPTVEMPLLLVTSNLNNNTRCGDKEFRGTIDVELIYFPSPNPRAEVKVTLEIRRRNNCSASLSKTELGIFRNDVTEDSIFSGELTNACADGDFTVSAKAVNQGPGATMIADATRVDIDAIPYNVSMPTQISTSNGRDFTLDIAIVCCEAGIKQTIKFDNISGVANLAAAPDSFTCAAPNAPHTITITVTGRKIDENQVGVFSVKADSLFGKCLLGSVQVE